MVKAGHREAGYVSEDETYTKPAPVSSQHTQSNIISTHQRPGTGAQGPQQKVVAKKGKGGGQRQKSKSLSKPLSQTRPSQLLTQRSVGAITDRRHSYDSHVTIDRSHDSHMTRSGKEQLPKVFAHASGMFLFFPVSPSPLLPIALPLPPPFCSPLSQTYH